MTEMIIWICGLALIMAIILYASELEFDKYKHIIAHIDRMPGLVLRRFIHHDTVIGKINKLEQLKFSISSDSDFEKFKYQISELKMELIDYGLYIHRNYILWPSSSRII